MGNSITLQLIIMTRCVCGDSVQAKVDPQKFLAV